ncbi:hypothetical protein C0J52_09393 [Blattella germanica]|nr:hypothetical protein C0J52_09393 [Blattella germanica]
MYSLTMKWSLIIVTVLIGGAVFAEHDDSPFPTNLQDINLGKLPGNLSIPGNIDLSGAPTLEDGEKLLEEKCKKMGHPEAYAAAVGAKDEVKKCVMNLDVYKRQIVFSSKFQGAKDEVKKCVMNLVNVTELQAEMEKAKPTGDLDIVFKKYCRKSPDLQRCITNFTSTVEPCLDEKEKESKYLVQNISESIVKFICHKEGDRIALFIAEGGPECLSSNQEAIQECVNKTIAKNMPKETLSIENLPSDFQELQNCVAIALQRCEEPTPANIVESLFNFVRKMTPCKNEKLKKEGRGSDTSGASMSVGMTVMVLLSASLPLLAGRNLH